MGLHRLSAVRRGPVFLDLRERWPWLVFFLALVVVGPASAWRHLAPDNAGLAWDRLAISVVFMSWFAAHLARARDAARLGDPPEVVQVFEIHYTNPSVYSTNRCVKIDFTRSYDVYTLRA